MEGVPTTSQTPLSGHFSPVLAVLPIGMAMMLPFKIKLKKPTHQNVQYAGTRIMNIKSFSVNNKKYFYNELHERSGNGNVVGKKNT